MNRTKQTLSSMGSLSLIATLTACGGSGTTPPVANTYQTLNSTAAATSTLTGTAAKGNDGSATIVVSGVSGSLVHNTGALTVNDGTYSMTDTNGVDASGVATDGSSVLTASSSTQGFSGSYQYVVPYEQTYQSGGDNYVVPGFYGVGTNNADMAAATGSATYNGEARGVVGTASSSNVLTGGTSVVTVNFGTNKVDATMSGFATSTAPIDTITVTGMDLTNNRFSGGAFKTTKNGAVVVVTGTNTATTTNGNFFGIGSAGPLPDEAAGISVSQGDAGLVIGAFIVD